MCVCAAAASYKKVRTKKMYICIYCVDPAIFLQVIHIRGYSDFFDDAPSNVATVFQVETKILTAIAVIFQVEAKIVDIRRSFFEWKQRSLEL